MQEVEKTKRDFIIYMEALLSDIEFMEEAEELLTPFYELVCEEEIMDKYLDDENLEDFKLESIENFEKHIHKFKTNESLYEFIAAVLKVSEDEAKNMFS